MAKVLTRRQWRTGAVSALQPHLHSDETLFRIVQAASVGRVWTVAFTELLLLSPLVRGVFHFPSKIVTIGAVIVIFLALNTAFTLTKFRSIVVTDQRILVFDAGRWSNNPTKRLLRELAPVRAIEIPSKRWRRFVSMGEALYFLASSEFVRAGLATQEHGLFSAA